MKAIAHRLKGSYANLRLTDISTAAHEIDELAQSQGDIERIKGNLTRLKAAFQGLKEKLI